MPDYNPAVAAGFQPQQTNVLGTLEGISQLQIGQAHAGLYSLQALKQQRDYNALAAGASAYSRSGNVDEAVQAVVTNGGSPELASQFQNLGAKRNAINAAGGMTPEDRNSLLEGGAKVRAGAAQLANQYAADPTPQNWQAMRDYTAKYQGEDQAKQLDAITDPNARMARATGHIGGGLTAEQGATEVKTETPQGAPQFQTRAQFLRGTAPQAPQAPGAGAPSGGPIVGQTPEAKAESEKFGQSLGEYLPKLQDEAAAAKTMNMTLGQMREESKGFTMGAYAPTATTMAKYLKPIANSVGSTAFDNWVGSNEDFAKNAGVLARQGVREISNRPSQFEFQAVSGQMPHDAMSEQGFNGIVDQFQAVNDFKQAKAFAAQRWQTSNGTMKGFEADWNSHIGPAAFLIANMSPQRRSAAIAGLPQKTRDSLLKQLQWADQNGLENGVF